MAAERKSFGSPTSSPEFEFWMVRNPSFPQPTLHSADELFVDGVILPLHLLRLQDDDEPQPMSEKELTSPEISIPTASKRWKDLFRGVSSGDKNPSSSSSSSSSPPPHHQQEQKASTMMTRKKNRKSIAAGGGAAAELNINIWPFSRSRSAGNSTSVVLRLFPKNLNKNNNNNNKKKKKTSTGRKVSSAPCSRSNSRGESSSSSSSSKLSNLGRVPARALSGGGGGGGVHVGRSSTIWQVRKTIKKTPQATESPTEAVEDLKSGVELDKNKWTCDGDGDGDDDCDGGDTKLLLGAGDMGDNSNSSSHFNLKALFSRKVY